MAETPSSPATIVRQAARTIGAEERVSDLIAVEGVVELRGVVRGHVFAVDSTLVIRSQAVILDSITVYRGALSVEPGAVLPKDVNVYGAAVQGAALEVRPAPSSTVSLALMRAYLPFDRFVPAEGVALAVLQGWSPKGDLEQKKAQLNASELVLGGLARIKVVSDQVRSSAQLGYVGEGKTVLITGVELANPDAGRALWAEVERASEGKKLPLSFRSALGEGVHWSYRIGAKDRARTVLLWQRGRWLFSVEARAETSPAEEQQLLLEVLSALRTKVSHVESGGAPVRAPRAVLNEDEGAHDVQL